MIERFLEDLVMQFKFRTRLVVTCAHRIAPRGLINMPLPKARLPSKNVHGIWNNSGTKGFESAEV